MDLNKREKLLKILVGLNAIILIGLLLNAIHTFKWSSLISKIMIIFSILAQTFNLVIGIGSFKKFLNITKKDGDK